MNINQGKEMNRLFGDTDFGVEEKTDSVDTNVIIDDVDSIYASMEADFACIDNGVVTMGNLEGQVTLEERMLSTDGVTSGALVLSRDSLRIAMEDLGDDLSTIDLGLEIANLPSTQLDLDADMRKSVDAKKGLIKKIIDAIKKIFAKLYIKAAKLYAKISMLLNANKIRLKAYIAKMRKFKFNSITMTDSLEVSARSGMYYIMNGRKFNTKLLKILMYDKELLEMSFSEIKALSDIKQYDETKIIEAVKLRKAAVIEHAPLVEHARSLKEVMKGKDVEVLLSTGKLIGLTGNSLTFLTIEESTDKDILKRLASRKIVTSSVSMGIYRVLNGRVFFDVDIKEDIIPFLEDLSGIIDKFEDYNKEIDDFSKKLDSAYKDLSKSAVNEAAGTMRASMTICNKLMLGISTTKRIAIAKLVNSLVDTGGMYANNGR